MTDGLSIANDSRAVSPPPAATVLNRAQTQADLDQLVVQCKQGSSGAFQTLVELFERRIFHYLWQMTGNQHDAEDLTQITFLKAFRNIHRCEGQRSFGAWLFTIAKRTALNHLRDRRPSEELAPDLAVETESPSITIERADERQDLWALARTLKPNQHEVLWLRYGEGFSISQIAGIMKTNALRVRVLLHRARSALGKSSPKDLIEGGLMA